MLMDAELLMRVDEPSCKWFITHQQYNKYVDASFESAVNFGVLLVLLLHTTAFWRPALLLGLPEEVMGDGEANKWNRQPLPVADYGNWKCFLLMIFPQWLSEYIIFQGWKTWD